MKARLLAIVVFLISTLFGQTNIAVMDFEGKNVSKDDASALTDRLRATLFLTGKFVILEREKMDAILKEQGFQQSGCTSDACAVEVGQLLAVEQMVVGSISKVGQTYSVTARLVGMEKGNLISVGTCDLRGDIGDVMTCLSSVASQLAGNQPIPSAQKPQSQKSTDDNMVFVKGGTFQMGSKDGNGNEKPVHKVTVSDFWIGKFEVTQKEWREIMNTNPSNFKGDSLPVENVNWYDALEFCNQKSLNEGLIPCYVIDGKRTSCNWEANGYRLPTEVEWEYAARGGNQSKGYAYGGSDVVDMVAWYSKNSENRIHPIGTQQPNELGLFDMSGNVFEWCWDRYKRGYYQNSSSVDPKGPSSGWYRVLRGGSCIDINFICRTSYRYWYLPNLRYNLFGFRCVRTEE